MPSRTSILPRLTYGFVAFGIVAALLAFYSAFALPREALRFDATATLSAPGTPSRLIGRTWFLASRGNPSFREGIYRSEYRLQLPPDAAARDASCLLVFPNVSGNAFRVSLNGVILGSLGDFDAGRSNIWNSALIVSIPPGSLAEDNRCTLEALGIYEAGVTSEPYVIERSAGQARAWLLRFVTEASIRSLIGAITAMGIVILAVGLASLPLLDARILIGIAALCSAAFFTDFVATEYLLIPLVDFKRLTVALRHLAVAIFALGYLKLLGRKADWFAKSFVLVQGLCAVAVLFPPGMRELKELYSYTYLTVAPFQFYLLYLLLTDHRDASGRRILLAGVSVGLLTALHDSILPLFNPGAIYLSHFGFMILILATTGFVVSDILNHYRQLLVEKSRAERYREDSLHDPLTRAYNRGVLPLVREGLSGEFSVIVLDLDEFKRINDCYGHFVGDRVLVDAVSVMNRVFRRDDYVVRTGGDEFLVVLPDCPGARAETLVAELREALAASRVSTEGETGSLPPEEREAAIRYSASIGTATVESQARPSQEDFEAAVREADRRLYEDKLRRQAGR